MIFCTTRSLGVRRGAFPAQAWGHSLGTQHAAWGLSRVGAFPRHAARGRSLGGCGGVPSAGAGAFLGQAWEHSLGVRREGVHWAYGVGWGGVMGWGGRNGIAKWDSRFPEGVR